jgi:hypothetical protein
VSATEPYERTPPAGEEVHLPGPSVLPFVSGLAITAIVVGTTIWWVWSAIGGVLLIICVFLWVSDTSRDVASLPEEHQH